MEAKEQKDPKESSGSKEIEKELKSVATATTEAISQGGFTTREKDEILKRLHDLEQAVSELSGNRDLAVNLQERIDLIESSAKRIPAIRTFFDTL